jgi:hypothetical protein
MRFSRDLSTDLSGDQVVPLTVRAQAQGVSTEQYARCSARGPCRSPLNHCNVGIGYRSLALAARLGLDGVTGMISSSSMGRRAMSTPLKNIASERGTEDQTRSLMLPAPSQPSRQRKTQKN